jgi:hypothetical protein
VNNGHILNYIGENKMKIDKDKIILNKIIEWLENKADDDCGSGIDDLIVSLEAKDLLDQIKKWEAETVSRETLK